MLKQRIITAAILICLALPAVFATSWDIFLWIIDGIILLAAWEWANLSGYSKKLERLVYIAAIAVAIIAMHIYYPRLPIRQILVVSLCSWLLALYWVVRFPKDQSWSGRWQRGIIGLFVLLPCWLSFAVMKASISSNSLILFLFLMVWGADSGAFFAGKYFGKTALAASVSPKKTREGLYGGLISCMLVAIGYALIIPEQLSGVQISVLVLLSVLVGLISVLGDLFESMLKRYRGIKDSSQLLPGHGGILDRIDSLTAASPLFILGMQYLGLG